MQQGAMPEKVGSSSPDLQQLHFLLPPVPDYSERGSQLRPAGKAAALG